MHENQNIYTQVLIGEVSVNPFGINTVSWNKNHLEPEMIAVGGNNQDNAYNKIFSEHNSEARPNLQYSIHNIQV